MFTSPLTANQILNRVYLSPVEQEMLKQRLTLSIEQAEQAGCPDANYLNDFSAFLGMVRKNYPTFKTAVPAAQLDHLDETITAALRTGVYLKTPGK